MIDYGRMRNLEKTVNNSIETSALLFCIKNLEVLV